MPHCESVNCVQQARGSTLDRGNRPTFVVNQHLHSSNFLQSFSIFISNETKKKFRQITLSYVVSYAATNDLTWRMLVRTTDIEMADHLCVFGYVLSVHHFVQISNRILSMCKHMVFLPYVSFGGLSNGLIWCTSQHNHLVDNDELFAYALTMFFFYVVWQLYLVTDKNNL